MTSGPATARSATHLDLLAADRGAALHVLRLVLAGLAAAAVLVSGAGPTGPDRLLPLIAAWLLIAAGGELAARTGIVAPGRLVVGLLLLDGVWLAILRHRTGGAASALAILVVVHLVGATLATGHRTGLRLALWHGALAITGYAADLSAGRDARVDAFTSDPGAASVVAVGGLLVVAATVAVFSAVNERELRRGRDDMEALAAMSVVLDHSADVDTMVAAGMARLRHAAGMGRAAVLVRWEGETLLWGPDGRLLSADVVVTGTDLQIRQAWSEGRTRLVAEVSPVTDPDVASTLPGATNLVIVPVAAEGEPFAAVVVERGGRSDARIAARQVALIEQLAERLVLVLRSALLHREVTRLAEHDQLTGLFNRRVFDERLVAELARSERSGEPVGLVMVDADHFKAVNDVHGHQAGDAILRGLGRIVREACREVDLACRYGGEEIVVIAPGADGHAAQRLGERIRRTVERDQTLPVPVTVSVGVSSVPEHAARAESLVAAADAALYRAKESGRNRVESAPSAKVTRGREARSPA